MTITVAELQVIIKKGLESALAPSYWVIAEVGQVNIAANGHCYMELVERQESSNYTSAKISAAIWRYRGSALESRFVKSTSSPIVVGMKLLLCVKISYHELYGISAVVIDIEPSFTVGEAEKIRKETIEKLEKAGHLERNKQIIAPALLQRIAVISSEKAAGYGDFCNELLGNSYGYDYNVTLFPAVVQGSGAEASILDALERVYDNFELFDCLVIIRGGGSADDLSCFDSYLLSEAIAYSPLYVITGIGHERDSSIADMVAAKSLKTPTAVARYLIDNFLGQEQVLLEYKDFLKSFFSEEILDLKEQVNRASTQLHHLVKNAVATSSIVLAKKEQQIIYLSGQITRDAHSALLQQKTLLKKMFEARVAAERKALEITTSTLKSNSKILLSSQNSKLEVIDLHIKSFDPKRIVEMGYAIAQIQGKIIREGKDAAIGDELDIVLRDGVLRTKVIEKLINN